MVIALVAGIMSASAVPANARIEVETTSAVVPAMRTRADRSDGLRGHPDGLHDHPISNRHRNDTADDAGDRNGDGPWR